MTEKATDKQTALLEKLGVTFDYNMSKQAASKLIEECLAAGPKKKVIEAPQTDTIVSKPPFKPSQGTPTSFYVSYAKDLCVAMLEAHTKVRLEDKEVKPIGIDKLMDTAIHCIQMAKDKF